MLAKYECISLTAILQKHILAHNFWTKAHRMMILVSRTMFWGSRNQMAQFILIVSQSMHPSVCHQSVGPVHICLQSVFARLSVCPSDGQSSCLSVHPSVCFSIHPSVLPPVCLSVLWSAHLSIHQFVWPSVWQLLHPSNCLSGLHRGLLLTVTDDCSCLVHSRNYYWGSDFLITIGISPQKGANRSDSGQFDHFAPSNFNVWLRSCS